MKNRKGFTLAELLVVVAIISVLVAISIPVFVNQLHKAKVATDWANLRSMFADIQTEYINNSEDWSFVDKYSVSGGSLAGTGNKITCPNGTTIKLKGGSVFFLNHAEASKGYGYNYYLVYTCDNATADGTIHQLIITDQGIQTFD